ncbi:MAG: LamG-like jellyroll fold domain-containing protein [Bdellovibrionia bacterium]
MRPSIWTQVQDPAAYNLNQWNHAAVTYDSTISSGTLKIYKNGAQVATVNSIAAPTNGKVIVGNHLNSSGSAVTGMDGSLAVVQIYYRALSAQEIKQNCFAQQGRFSGTNICAAP